MNIVITSWALDSYLELIHNKAITVQDYKKVIRPDVLLLKTFKTAPSSKFSNNKFWSPATYNGNIIRNGFKMKWHNLGFNKIQLRLLVGLISKDAFLFQAYVKVGSKEEVREIIKFRTRLLLVQQNKYVECGRL